MLEEAKKNSQELQKLASVAKVNYTLLLTDEGHAYHMYKFRSAAASAPTLK